MVGKGVAGERTQNQISFWEIYKQEYREEESIRRRAIKGHL